MKRRDDLSRCCVLACDKPPERWVYRAGGSVLRTCRRHHKAVMRDPLAVKW